MKKLSVLLMVALMLISNVMALPTDSNKTQTEESYEDYIVYEYNDGTTHIFFNSDGENIAKPNSSEFEVENSSSGFQLCGAISPVADDVIINSVNQVEGKSYKVTPDVVGPATIGVGKSITVTDSFGVQLSAKAKTGLLMQLEVDFGVSWNHSLASNASFNMSFNVPKGKKGSIYFTPYYWEVKFTYYNPDGTKSGRSTVKTPKETDDGFADGYYELVLR